VLNFIYFLEEKICHSRHIPAPLQYFNILSLLDIFPQ